MAKLRIYELARELGLDNKEVLAICEKLGIGGKKSHSNSLTDSEADKIRRSLIRSAVADKKTVREISRDDAVLTERRVGNVIRRRKKSSDKEPAVQAKTKESEADTSEASPVTESAVDEVTEDQALEAKDTLAETEDQGSVTDTSEVVSSPSTDSDTLPASEPEVSGGDEVQEEEAAKVVEAAPEPEASDDSQPTPEEDSTAVSVEVTETKKEPVVEEKKVESVAEIAAASGFRAAKVLGKIDLPTPVSRPSKASETESSDSRGPAAGGRAGRKGGGSRASEAEDPRKKRAKRKRVLRKDDLIDYDGDGNVWRQRRDKRTKKKSGDSKPVAVGPKKASKLVIKVEGEISVGELSRLMSVKSAEVIMKLMGLGVPANINQFIDLDTASLIAEEFGYSVQSTGSSEEEFIEKLAAADKPEELELRPPVVTVMGHVDHGKTSLLDSIRETSVADREAGGITQHIGAYTVDLESGAKVTFLDTPGHAAFTAMRGRGAQVTDIVVLVVAADDGVMPQTIEAINHAKAAEVPIIVAVNKMDKEEAQPDRVKTQLSEHGLVAEDWGGDVIFAPVSAHTKEGIPELLENLSLQAEILELKANPNRRAIGTVIESRLDNKRGAVITVLVQNGTLKKTDSFLCGATFGRVKALTSATGEQIQEAGPSIPVEVLGVSTPPQAGDDFFALENESEARRYAEQREFAAKKKKLSAKVGAVRSEGLTLENFSEQLSRGEVKELPLIVKADVAGSMEAVRDALEKLENEEASARVIHTGIGGVTENDIQLAMASQAIIIAFNVRADTRARALSEKEGVQVQYSRVIYELVETVEKALTGMLKPVEQEKTLGRVEVRETFRVPKLGMVAGSYVVDGIVKRGSKVRLLRDNRVVYEGNLASLRRFKDDVREVAAGYECGIGIEGFSDIQGGDVMEVYMIETVQPGL